MRLIDAQRLVDTLLANHDSVLNSKVLSRVETIISSMPEADPVMHGYWNDAESFTGEGSNTYECSKCGFVLQLMDGNPADNQYAYCPHCGAMMAYQSSKFPKIGNEVTE